MLHRTWWTNGTPSSWRTSQWTSTRTWYVQYLHLSNRLVNVCYLLNAEGHYVLQSITTRQMFLEFHEVFSRNVVLFKFDTKLNSLWKATYLHHLYGYMHIYLCFTMFFRWPPTSWITPSGRTSPDRTPSRGTPCSAPRSSRTSCQPGILPPSQHCTTSLWTSSELF